MQLYLRRPKGRSRLSRHAYTCTSGARRTSGLASGLASGIALFAALGGSAAAAGQDGASAPEEIAPGALVRDIVARSGETYRAEYGFVKVPENRADPDSSTIEVAYVRVRSGLATKRPPVVYLEGGPGGPGIPFVERSVEGGGSRFFELIGADVIGIDQRGVGRSRPSLDSDTLYGFELSEPATREGRIARLSAIFAEEARRWRDGGVDLSGYNSNESADDVDAIRAALGYESMTLFGASYGTHLAMAVMRRHPGRVARALLAGPEGPDHTVKLPSYAQEGLERIAELVAQDEALAPLVPDFLALVGEVLTSLGEQPAVVDLDGVEVGISKLDVQEHLVGAIGFSANGIGELPATLLAMKAGDFSTIAAQIAQARREDGVWTAMGLAVDAASGLSPERSALIAIEAKACLLGDAATYAFAPTAKALGVPDLGSEFRSRLKSDVPVLFVVGDLDSRTPIRNARELMRDLPNAQLIVVENAAHAVPMGLPELRDAWGGFLRGEEVTLERVAAEPIRFALPASVPETIPAEAIAVEAADLERCAGTYEFSTGMSMVIRVHRARLAVEVPGKGTFALWPKAPNVYFCSDGPIPELTFEFDSDEGKASRVKGGGTTAERR